MKKTIIILLISMISIVVEAQNYTLESIRDLYQKAPTDKASCLKINTDLAAMNLDKNPVLYGYKAVSKMMMANYVNNPFTKLSYFNEGKKMLENAIKNDNSNLELRFLRLSTQENTPSFLGYNSDITTDKKFIQLSLASLKDIQLKTLIENYLK